MAPLLSQPCARWLGGLAFSVLLAGCQPSDSAAQKKLPADQGVPRGIYAMEDGTGSSVSMKFSPGGRVSVTMITGDKTDEAEGTYELLNNRLAVKVRGETMEFARKGTTLEGWKSGHVIVFQKR